MGEKMRGFSTRMQRQVPKDMNGCEGGLVLRAGRIYSKSWVPRVASLNWISLFGVFPALKKNDELRLPDTESLM